MAEDKLATATATTRKLPLNGEDNKNKKKKKKRSALAFIKAVMLMLRMRGRSNRKTNPLPSKCVLNKLVGSMRPLNLQDNRYSPSPPPPSYHLHKVQQPDHATSPAALPSPKFSFSSEYDRSMGQYGSAINPRDLYKEGGSSSPSSDGRYASTTNLQELDRGSSPSLSSDSRYASAMNLVNLGGDRTDDDDDYDDDDEKKGDRMDLDLGDEMIDVKAEEFIAQFYKQMRLQHLSSSVTN